MSTLAEMRGWLADYDTTIERDGRGFKLVHETGFVFVRGDLATIEAWLRDDDVPGSHDLFAFDVFIAAGDKLTEGWLQ